MSRWRVLSRWIWVEIAGDVAAYAIVAAAGVYLACTLRRLP